MKLEPLILAVLVMSTLMMASARLISDVNTFYTPDGNVTDTDELRAFNRSISFIENRTQRIEKKITGITTKTDTNIFTQTQDTFVLFLDVLGVIVSIPGIMLDFIVVGTGLIPGGIPGEFRILFGLGIIVVFIFKAAQIALKSSDI